MANKPYMCAESEVTVPECDNCDELESRLKALEDFVEECCQEVKDTLDIHTDQIADIYDQIELLRVQIESLTGLRTEVVDELPAVGEPNVIYLIEEAGGTYSMWLYSDNEWLQVGGGSIDLSNYVTTSDLQTALTTALANYVTTNAMNTALAGKQDTLTAGTGIRIDSNTVQRVPLIGEIVPKGANTAPTYYGTYTLVDKDFENKLYNDENVSWVGAATNRSSVIRRRGKTIQVKLNFDMNLSDNRTRICKTSLSTLGLTSVPYQYVCGYCDATHQIGMFEAYEENGYMAVDCIDAVPHTGNSKETWYVQFDVMFGYAQMDNDACNKFYWKRTA